MDHVIDFAITILRVPGAPVLATREKFDLVAAVVLACWF